ncbi:MAG: hypothetical protein FWC11_00360 [Firmicutes bacterium]|nr:hypothetical protein [Bacillota bacterium]
MKKEICKKCEHYSAYYKKHICSFSPLRHGTCSLHKKSIEEFETCKNFKCNKSKEKRKGEFLLTRLENCLLDIHLISQILKENSATTELENDTCC